MFERVVELIDFVDCDMCDLGVMIVCILYDLVFEFK